MGHKDVAEYLVKNDAVVDFPAASGVTAMWLAAGEGRTPIIQFLLRKNADVNNKRMDGITALMAACVGGHLEAATLLVKEGADVHAVDQVGSLRCTLRLTSYLLTPLFSILSRIPTNTLLLLHSRNAPPIQTH